jgi:hypothetical protein
MSMPMMDIRIVRVVVFEWVVLVRLRMWSAWRFARWVNMPMASVMPVPVVVPVCTSCQPFWGQVLPEVPQHRLRRADADS